MRPLFGTALFVLVALAPCAQRATAQEVDLFDSSVETAIGRGVEALKARVEAAAAPGAIAGGMSHNHPLGMKALCAYALLESGVPTKSPGIGRLFAEMDAMPLTKTYSVAVYVLALDAYWRHCDDGRKDEEPQGRTGVRGLRGEERGLQQRLKRCIEWLVEARMKGEGLWGYTPVKSKKRNINEWVDFSVTQFAVLALGVGDRRGIPIPEAVWRELIRQYEQQLMVLEDEKRMRCEGPGWWDQRGETSPKPGDDFVTFEGGSFEVHGAPVGWAYRPQWNQPPWNVHRTSYSMVAAATSSLVVAREALGKKATRSQRDRADEMIIGGLMTLARDFGTLAPSRSATLWRNYFYTIYSLEKALDLGGVELLDGIDWYRSQARVLITDQRSDGSWGRSSQPLARDTEYDTVSTAFALLFLKRATRALRITPLVPIVTFEDTDDDGAPQQVFLPSLGGMISVGDAFSRLRQERTRKLLSVVEELVGAVPPYQRPYLLDFLAQLRNGSGDAVDRYALDQVAAISGWTGTADRDRLRGWIANYKILNRWGRRKTVSAIPEINELMGTSPTPLVLVALTTLERIGSLESVPAVLVALESGEASVRARAHRALAALLSESNPPSLDRPASEIAGWWSVRWEARGPELRAARKWDALRQSLEQAQTPGDRARVRAEIVALGAIVLPRVDAMLQRDEFLFDWVLIREALTGEKRGI